MGNSKNQKILLWLNHEEATRLIHAHNSGNLEDLDVVKVRIPLKKELPRDDDTLKKRIKVINPKGISRSENNPGGNNEERFNKENESIQEEDQTKVRYVFEWAKNNFRVISISFFMALTFIFIFINTYLPRIPEGKLLADHTDIPEVRSNRAVLPIKDKNLSILDRKGVDYFKAEHFQESSDTYQMLYKNTQDSYYRLFWGISLLRMGGKYEEAIQYLQPEPKVVPINEQFLWHLIVAHYANKTPQKFKDAMCAYEDYQSGQKNSQYFRKSVFQRLKKQEQINCD